MNVAQQKAGYADMNITQEQVDAINALGAQGNVFERLAASIAPEIYGMREVKKVGGGCCSCGATRLGG
jgi:DNA replicative helicase MCM subunit Mcm2 (Cdc46/Mcm family)